MLNEENILKRLALIKSLYLQGVSQSKYAEPMSAFSILSFHDSIEMFLRLLCEKLNIKAQDLRFMQYWDKVPELTLKESCRDLNARRRSFKHNGISPSKSDIETSRVVTTDFFEQNTIRFFGVKFSEVSLINLVKYEEVRAYLEEAQSAFVVEKYESCIENVACAFWLLLTTYENSKVGLLDSSSPFNFKRHSRYNHLRFNSEDVTGKQINRLTETVNRMSEVLKVVSLGIDYKQYIKFKALTPNIIQMMSGKLVAEIYGERKWDQHNCMFCLDFVIETSLKLQEFDYDMSELEIYSTNWNRKDLN